MSQYAAEVVEKADERIEAALYPLRVPAKFEDVLVNELTPLKVLLSERSVEEAEDTEAESVVPESVNPLPILRVLTGFIPLPIIIPFNVEEPVPPC